MKFEMKYMFYLDDFCMSAQFVVEQLNYLENTISSFLSKKKPIVYIGNKTNNIYIYQSLFNRHDSSFEFSELRVEFNKNLNILVNYNQTVLEESLFLKDYTFHLFESLDKVFINKNINTASVNWFYTHDIKTSDIKDNSFFSIEIANLLFYKNKNELFKSVEVTKEINNLPTKKNLSEQFNLLTSKTIVCEIRGFQGDNASLQDIDFKSKIPIEINTEVITSNNIIEDLSNIETNNSFFIRRDLTNVEQLKIKDKEILEDDDVLNTKEINNLLKNYKDINDYTIDSSYSVKNSTESNHAATASKVVSIIKTYLEEFYFSTIEKSIDNLPTTNVLKLIKFYEDKIKEIKSEYLLLEDYSLTEFHTHNNYCLKTSNPLTFTLQKKCIDAKISIEDSNKVMTKNVLKCWLKQCLDERASL